MRFAVIGGRIETVRLVIDTNILIRALRSPGPARQFLKWAPLSHVLIYHRQQILELHKVAARPRLRIETEAVEELVERIQYYGQNIDVELTSTGDCRDPKDEYVLDLARVGSAEAILSEDQDLLVLDPWRGVRILRLFQFFREHPLSGL